MNLIDWAERGLIPDSVTRIGIRRLLAARDHPKCRPRQHDHRQAEKRRCGSPYH